MNRQPSTPIIIFTDLDGTLLDHHDYSTRAAKDTLALIHKHAIPLIFNTSKTLPEVQQLRRTLENTSPFVCENGSAIYYHNATGHLACELPGASYTDILKVLNELRKDGFSFRGFNDMTDTEVAAITGLSTEEAHFARQRAATEPLLWRGSEEELDTFAAALAHHDLRILKGGRFYHVMGKADKSTALSFFSAQYEKEYGTKPIIIALGDGENDRAMLEAADFPVIIPGDKSTLTIENPAAVTASFKGPKGWNEQLLPLLEKLLKETCSG